MPRLTELLRNPNYVLLTEFHEDTHFDDIYVTDLLSTAIKHMKPSHILITMISSQSVLSLSQMLDLKTIILTKDALVTDKLIKDANELGLTIIKTSYLNHEVVIELCRRHLL